MRSLLLAAPLALLTACSATPPANWERGGAVLEIPRARWVLGDGAVDLMPDGRIFLNGEHHLSVDRGGRVFDVEGEPMALLEPDGKVIGPGDKDLGLVGAMHASLPEEQTAWLSVVPTGEVIRYDEEGERYTFGLWMGCNVSMRAHQACMLITHLVGLRIREASRSGPGGWGPGGMGGPGMGAPGIGGSGVGIGIGVGVGVPLR
ncbi:MAG TPA: hypothetical protein VLS89_00605 [Candidatus Nanopelagicales bacterium]|nr:hypothetical protein [Candidatus Nanopelagicales bacterium]